MPKPIKKTVKDFCSRNAPLLLDKIDRAKTDAPIPTVVATEKPAMVIDWGRREFIHEVLLMSGAEFPESRQVTLHDSHWIWDTSTIMGSERDLRVEGNELLGDTHISSVAERQKVLADEGHLTDVSAGYRTYKEHSVVIGPGKEETVNGRSYKNDFNDGLNLIIRTKWSLSEVSLVPMGADDLAKFKREAADESELEPIIRADDPELQKVINEAVQRSLGDQKIIIKSNGGSSMKTPEEIAEEKRKQVAEDAIRITDFGQKRFNGKYGDLALRAVSEKKTFEEFNEMVNVEREKKGYDFETPHSFLDLSNQDLQRFNLVELINFEIQRKSGKLSDAQRKNRYTEMSDEIAKRSGFRAAEGIFLPYDLYQSNPLFLTKDGQRAHTVGTATEGGHFVQTELRDDLMAAYLKNETALGQSGATIIAGLKGNLEIPTIVSSLSVAAVAENADTAASYVVLGQKTAQPHRITGNTEYGEQLEVQSSISFSQLLLKELRETLDIKIDYLGINGDGVGVNPLGLLNMSGIDAQVVGSPTFRKMMKFRTAVKKANAFGKGNFKWLCSPDVEEVLSTTPKESGQPIYLMNEEGKMVATPSLASNQVPDQVLIYGDWSKFYVLSWGIDELIVNPYTQHKKHVTEISIHSLVDYFLRQDQSFSISDDVTIA